MNRWTISIMVLLALCAGSVIAWADTGGQPFKLHLSISDTPIWKGREALVQIEVHDADNQPALSPQASSIKLLVNRPSGSFDPYEVDIPAEAGHGEKTVLFDETGVYTLEVSHQHLLSDSTIAVVKQSPQPPSKPDGGRENGGTRGGGVRGDIFSILNAPGAATPQIEMKVTPANRPLLADGKDQALVYAYITGETASAAQDITIKLHSDAGLLNPSDLIIPRGKVSGSTTVTSTQVGMGNVELINTIPKTNLVGNKREPIRFVPPVAGIELKASPPVLTTVENTELIVRLVDNKGRPLNSYKERTVSFAINDGSGQLSDSQAAIASGQAEARIRFLPSRSGTVSIGAATPNLQPVTTQLNVRLPVLLLICMVAGAIAGGAMAYWMEQDARWWRIAIGLPAGVAAYWAVGFSGMDLLAPELVRKPLAAFSLSLIGGWGGTKALAALLKRYQLAI